MTMPQAKIDLLNPEDTGNALAALHVEEKLLNLQLSSSVTHHQLETARVGARQRAHQMLSPAAQEVVEIGLRQMGVLKCDHTPGDPNFNLGAFLPGGAEPA
jgi:hypothetical protein